MPLQPRYSAPEDEGRFKWCSARDCGYPDRPCERCDPTCVGRGRHAHEKLPRVRRTVLDKIAR